MFPNDWQVRRETEFPMLKTLGHGEAITFAERRKGREKACLVEAGQMLVRQSLQDEDLTRGDQPNEIQPTLVYLEIITASQDKLREFVETCGLGELFPDIAQKNLVLAFVDRADRQNKGSQIDFRRQRVFREVFSRKRFTNVTKAKRDNNYLGLYLQAGKQSPPQNLILNQVARNEDYARRIDGRGQPLRKGLMRGLAHQVRPLDRNNVENQNAKFNILLGQMSKQVSKGGRPHKSIKENVITRLR